MASGSRGRGGAQVLCKYHPDALLIEDAHAGDMICTECGLVVVERCIDVGSEWRTFGSDKDAKDNSRVGAAENSLLDGADLSTTISMGTGAASFGEDGRPLYSSKRNNMSSSDRALLSAFREISQMADRLNLPSMIVDRADTLFKQVHVTKTLKGRSNDAIATACLYIACRKEGVPRTFKEICAVSKISKKEIGRVFKLILKNLSTSVELVTTTDYMSRFCANLSLSNTIKKAAMEIARKACEFDIVAGKSPVSVAAAAIYMASQASDDKRQAKDIGEIAGVAEVTIRQTYRALLTKAHELFPADFEFTTPIENLPNQ